MIIGNNEVTTEFSQVHYDYGSAFGQRDPKISNDNCFYYIWLPRENKGKTPNFNRKNGSEYRRNKTGKQRRKIEREP